MKFTISPRLGENEEALNIIIKNFTEQVLQGTIEEKQKFLIDNGLASHEEEEKVDWDHAEPEEEFDIAGKSGKSILDKVFERAMNEILKRRWKNIDLDHAGSDNNEPPMPNPRDANKPSTVCLCNPTSLGWMKLPWDDGKRVCEHGNVFYI
jgi:hypothetical protein